jgi:hypothetical protein
VDELRTTVIVGSWRYLMKNQKDHMHMRVTGQIYCNLKVSIHPAGHIFILFYFILFCNCVVCVGNKLLKNFEKKCVKKK